MMILMTMMIKKRHHDCSKGATSDYFTFSLIWNENCGAEKEAVSHHDCGKGDDGDGVEDYDD